MNRIFRYSMTALLTSSLLTATQLLAEVHTWTDANGNRVFSDQPGPGSKTVEVRPVNTVETPPAPQSSTSASSAAYSQDSQPRGPVYERLSIVSHQNDEALRANDGTFALTVQTEPPLSPGHLLRAEIDGRAVSVAVPGNGSREHQLQIANMDRGTHSVSVAVINARGDVVQRSAPLELHVQRTSLNQPARAGANQAPRAPAAPRAPNVPAPGGN